MGNPTVFPKLRGSTVESTQARTQDNTDIVLRPIAEALGRTPIMGVAPVWTALELNPLYTRFDNFYAAPGYYVDALMRVWVKGVLTSAAGAPGGTRIASLPLSARPKEGQIYSVNGGAAYHRISMRPDGDILDLTGTGAGGSLSIDFSFLVGQ
jgi:hypothetical protein